MTSMNILEQSYINGFIKAANQTMIPGLGAPNPLIAAAKNPMQPGTGQPQQMQQKPAQPQQAASPFAQLMVQFKQQNAANQPPIPSAIQNIHNHPLRMQSQIA